MIILHCHYPVNKLVPYDLEIYPNYNLFGALWNDKVYQFDHTQLSALLSFLRDIEEQGYQLAGFNSIGYDDPVLWAILMGGGNPDPAYQTSLAIIEQGVKYWDLPGEIESVDLMQILPGRKPLKQLGVILQHPKLQELPIDPHKALTPSEMMTIVSYNRNDLVITDKLMAELMPQLELRSRMSDIYGIDLRSKGEAAIAETVLVSEAGYTKKDLKNLAQVKEADRPEFRVKPPTWWDEICGLIPDCPAMSSVVQLGEKIFHTDLRITNHRVSGDQLSHTLYLGDRFYAIGVGGLHSVDGPGAWVPGDEQEMVDIDVTSYYPSLILTQKLQPSYWNDQFLPIYREVYEQRLTAKNEGDKTTADVLKIVLNGSFGKFGDRFSALYDQEMLAHVTVYGQLGLLSLIAMLVEAGHRVVSANTDGVTVIHNTRGVPDTLKAGHVVYAWEQITGLRMEFTEYKGLYQRDVNNYIAVKQGGGVKTKGIFNSEPDLRHMPNYLIVAKAIKAYLEHGVDVAQTVRGEENIHYFILTTAVRGAWKVFYGDRQIGKIVRFYKSTTLGLPQIRRVPVGEAAKGNEGIIPDSTNGVPVEDLPETIPNDLDRQWYIDKAKGILAEITRAKVPGMNAWAQELINQRLQPVLVDTTSKMLSRAEYVPGNTDFCSLVNGHAMGVRTGFNAGILACVRDGVTTQLHQVGDKYPSKTRAKVEKEEGFQLIYGGSVEVPPWGVPVSNSAEETFDRWYTAAELKKVGR